MIIINKKRIIGFSVIIVLFFCIIFLFSYFSNQETSNINNLEELTFESNPFSERAIRKEAKKNDIKEENTAFYSPTPEISGINEGLIYEYQINYGKGFYQGDKATNYNNLLLSYTEGILSKEEVIEDISSLTAWTEVGKGISRTEEMKQQVIVNDIYVGSFEINSNLANEIWAELANKNLLFNSDYYEILIYYDEGSQMNTVNILSVDLAYLAESWD